jgi:hypothetical protein
MAPALPALTLIHPSAWNRYSRKLNFAFHDFCELRITRILGSPFAGFFEQTRVSGAPLSPELIYLLWIV